MASSIKLFQSIQKYFQTLGICPSDSSKLDPFNWRIFLALFCYAQQIASATVFFICQAKSVLDYGCSFYTSISMAYCVYYFVILIRQKPQILELIESCEAFIEHRVNATINYKDLNAKIEQICEKIYFLMVEVSFVTLLGFPLLQTVLNYFLLDLKEQSYLLPTPVTLPFDWHTPFGYFLALITEGAAIIYTLLLVTTIVCLYVGSCTLFIAFLGDIKADVAYLNVSRSSDHGQRMVKERLCNIIQLYSDVKQLVDQFNTICQFIILVFFTWTLSNMCCSLLVIQSQLSGDLSDPMEIMSPLTEMLWSFALIAIYCEFSEKVTTEFDELNAELFRCDWYLLPNRLQQMYLIFILDTQQPKVIQGYGNILCTRDTFKKTTNTGFSYFMTLRQINA